MLKKASDHVTAVVKAAVAAVPSVGGPIAALITDCVPGSTQRDAIRMIDFLAAKIQELEDRIDVQTAGRDEFSELGKSCHLVAVRTHREEKLQAAANIRANCLLAPGDPAKCSYDGPDDFIRCIETLFTGTIMVLGALYLIGTEQQAGIQSQFHFARLQRALAHMDAGFLTSLVSELRGLNLIRVQEPVIRIRRSQDYDGYLLETTAIGRRLMWRFIEGDMKRH